MALWAAFCATGVTAMLIVFLILRYAVPVPMLDDWEIIPIIAKAHNGGFSLADLLAQQQEARTVVLKLVFIGLSFAKYWDSRVVMMLSVVVCCLTALGIYCLLRRSKLGPKERATAFVLVTLLIFRRRSMKFGC